MLQLDEKLVEKELSTMKRSVQRKVAVCVFQPACAGGWIGLVISLFLSILSHGGGCSTTLSVHAFIFWVGGGPVPPYRKMTMVFVSNDNIQLSQAEEADSRGMTPPPPTITSTTIKSNHPKKKRTLSSSSRHRHRKMDQNFIEASYFDHELLSKAQEYKLIRQFQTARKLQTQIDQALIALQPQTQSSVVPDTIMSNEKENEHLHHLLSDDLARHLGYESSRQMTHILQRGSRSKDILITKNLKLVISIAKRWMKYSQQQQRNGGSSSSSSSSSTFHHNTKYSYSAPIAWSDVLQEGVLGLDEAIRRFDGEHEKDTRLSTYATHWITNSIRRHVQRASTVHRLPVQYHDTKTQFVRLVKRHYQEHNIQPPQPQTFGVGDGTSVRYYHPSPPDVAEIAREMGTSEKRLRRILRFTQPAVSLETPMGGGRFSGSKLDGASSSSSSWVLSDILVDRDSPGPEQMVERSFLRQSLENAMAAELAPYERDVLRLRLGLDDNVVRSCRNIASEFMDDTMTASEIRGIEKRALRKLRSPVALSTHKLHTYISELD